MIPAAASHPGKGSPTETKRSAVARCQRGGRDEYLEYRGCFLGQ